ncbi:MAG TPA: NYN domain-containing protein [Ktedonobacteraceae bacterium]|nr:NYN domain-containing protein [Ktedonobacteraceae bacterium]
MVRRKKSETIMKTPAIQRDALAAPSVALLIDGENVMASDMIAHILAEAGKMGGVLIRRVYGNWATPSMHSWKEMMAHYELEQMNNVPTNAGRNATDIALVIGAMDLLYRGVKYFCLVAGDSDYLPLVLRLRQDGCTVLGIGTPKSSHTLKEACNRFLTTDQLISYKALQRSTSPSISSHPTTPYPEELLVLLTGAYSQVKKKDENEWIPLSALGKALKDCNPNFQDIYGKKKLSTLVEQYADCFETRLRKVGKGQTAEVRILKQKR